jgi:hypothetical protein
MTLRRPILIECIWLISISMADLISTVYLIGSGRCIEVNPIMNYFLQLGWAPFVMFKLFTVMTAVITAEWYRLKDEPFVKFWVRVAVVSYIVVWSIWFTYANFLT